MRSAREVVELYNYELWNRQRHELADELIGDSVVRHGIGTVTTLSHEQAAQRDVDTWARAARLEFVLHHVIADGELVSSVYERHRPTDRPAASAAPASPSAEGDDVDTRSGVDADRIQEERCRG